jgi:hypothetical protein
VVGGALDVADFHAADDRYWDQASLRFVGEVALSPLPLDFALEARIGVETAGTDRA